MVKANKKPMIVWHSEEYRNRLISQGILANYDSSSMTRETHDRQISEARKILDLNERIERFKEIYGRKELCREIK